MVIVVAVTAGVLFAAGVYLMLRRSLSHIVIGLVLAGHGANLLLLAAGGRAGRSPILGDEPGAGAYADPLPQAMALTAIVISFGLTVFLLALAHRSRQLSGDDQVEDDVEDGRIAALHHQHSADADHEVPNPTPSRSERRR